MEDPHGQRISKSRTQQFSEKRTSHVARDSRKLINVMKQASLPNSRVIADWIYRRLANCQLLPCRLGVAKTGIRATDQIIRHVKCNLSNS